MADHYTLRLAPGMRQRLSEWARRTHLPERTLAQRYVEEGLRHDAHPLIHFVDGPSGRRVSLVGRGLDVWEVIATVRDNDGSITHAAEYLHVPPGLVEAAVAYYGEYREEIDADIELNEAEYERGRAAAAAGERALRG
jgi:predicted transcriptional regulator